MKKDEPLISVIIPVYNAENHIKRQLRVIKDQEVQDIEVIFVDNNSEDQSVTAINNEINSGGWTFPISLLFEKKQGAGAARNLGLEASKGKYIAFLDADDKLIKGKWKKDLEILKNEPDVQFVFCRANRIYETGESLYHDDNDINLGINHAPHLGIVWAKHFHKLQNTSSALIEKKCAKIIEGFEDSLLIGEDVAFFVKLGYKYNGYYYNEPLFHYYKHFNSTTGKRNQERPASLDHFKLNIEFILPFFYQTKFRKMFVENVILQFHSIVSKNIKINQEYIVQLKNFADHRKFMLSPFSIYLSRKLGTYKMNFFLIPTLLKNKFKLFE